MRIVIIGGGPGGYEAALVAAELGADVTVVSDEGPGGACVLWDCVPSKTLLSSAQAFSTLETAPSLGVHFQGVARRSIPTYEVDLPTIMDRVHDLAQAQSDDIRKRLTAEGAKFILGTGRIADPHTVEVSDGGTVIDRLACDAILIATGSAPRRLETAPPDGEVILSSQDVYNLKEVPEQLVVIGAGATGAEYTTAFLRFGSHVTFVVSRDRVLPSEDEDAALVIEEVFRRRDLETVKNARAASVERVGDHGVVHLEDGRTVEGTHVLLTIGQVPQSGGFGLDGVGVQLRPGGGIAVDGVSRTSVPNIYAAGDVTGRQMLASVAAMQGRIEVLVEKLPLSSNSRAKMANQEDGFVKLLARPGSGTIVGGAVVAGYASDLIAPVSIACFNRLTANQLSQAFQIYPSFAGSIQECARLLAGRVQGGYRY